MNAPTDPTMPEWEVAQWFNTQQPISLADLRGQVVLVQAFQMLCPGCVIHAIPQARQVHEQLADQGVAMIGLHTVFEHHDAMHPHALAAFIHEYGLRFPVGVDAPSADGQPVPRTMALGLAGHADHAGGGSARALAFAQVRPCAGLAAGRDPWAAAVRSLTRRFD